MSIISSISKLKYQRQYYLTHRNQKIESAKRRYQKHRDEILIKRRQTVIRYNDHTKNIRNVKKPPYPEDGLCPYCRSNKRIQYHHWSDNNPNQGIWLCASCHVLLGIFLRHRSQFEAIISLVSSYENKIV